MKNAAIYARVSSAQQKEERTIASQTAALIDFAQKQGFHVPREWVFEDEGFSGASLERPGLERIRDLAAEGQLQAVLVYSPDRLSRKYAYQVLLTEEFTRHGVETVFVNAPASQTPEDQLLVQFQGMIAEYERAQILERSRRGKRHRARQGSINVLGNAPYGYHYVRKTQETAAYYEIIEEQAVIVRQVYVWYTAEALSIGAITRKLNEQGTPTRKRRSRWERSTVWAMLRNPAYKGLACFGKTKIAPRQRITRPLRLRGGFAQRNSASHERPRSERIEIPVPAIVEETVFDLAQERLQKNKQFSPRRTVAPSIVQSLVSCSKCGYGMYRTSTRTSARKVRYFRCLGSDAWRHFKGALCDNHPVRQDLLDQLVWNEILKLLEDPRLIQAEIERRLVAARDTNPNKKREECLKRDLTRTRKGMERLVSAYQETLLSLDELRTRMPELRRREQTLQAELKSFIDQTNDRAAYLRLTETLTSFLSRLRSSAQTLDVIERQHIARLLIKEVLVGDDTIIIRHSIPIPTTPAGDDTPPASAGPSAADNTSYLLRKGVLSPLLSSVYMRRFILGWRKLGYAERFGAHIVNYANDLVSCCNRGAGEAMQAMRQTMQSLKLTVNEEKTRVCRVPQESFDFLGYTFGRCYSPKTGRAFIGTRPSKKSIRRMVEKISAETGRRTTYREVGEVIERLNDSLRGWANYFRLGPVSKAYRLLDAHTTQRLRRWLCRKHKVEGGSTLPRYSEPYLHAGLGLIHLSMRTKSFPWAKA